MVVVVAKCDRAATIWLTSPGRGVAMNVLSLPLIDLPTNVSDDSCEVSVLDEPRSIHPKGC
jgi:hypothetical protein